MYLSNHISSKIKSKPDTTVKTQFMCMKSSNNNLLTTINQIMCRYRHRRTATGRQKKKNYQSTNNMSHIYVLTCSTI